jgi:peptidyl-Asp metalloendopeptidase
MQRVLTACLALFALSIFILGTSMAYAEGPELFTPLPADQLKDMSKDMSPVQRQRIDQIKQRPTMASMTMVRVDANALKGDSTRMSLPGAKALNFSKSNIEIRSANDFTWFGALSGVPGKAMFVVHDGNVTGTMRDDGNLYRVEPVGNGVHALIKVDESRFPPDEPPTFKEREKRGDAGPTPATALDTQKGDSPIGIDVLVAYTTAARTAVSDIAATVQLAVAEANQSYQNSSVNIRLTLVDSFEVSYSESGKSFEAILADFVGMADVNNRRNSSGADMAVLVINQSDYCGLADAILANASNAFAVVHYDCATGYYSFAHELGHLQGARHDSASDPTTTPFAYGHGFQHTSPALSWRTIMAYNCAGGCPRLQYWSNPNVNYNGIAMGTEATNNDARVLNGTASIVAGFRTKSETSGVQPLK